MKPALPSAEQGYSLVELLVVIVILGLVTTAIMTTFVTGQRHHSERDAAIRMQQQARLAMTEMERNIRMAGYGLMDIGSLKINVYNGSGGTNVYSAWVMVEATDGAGGNPDSITFRYQNPDLPTDESTDKITLTADYASPNPSSLSLSSSTGFSPGDLLIIYDPAAPDKPASLLQTSSIPNSTQIHHARQSSYPYNPPPSPPAPPLFPPGGYPEGSIVLNLRTIDFRTVTYSVNGENLIREERMMALGSPGPVPTRRIVATGIQDLQVRYQFADGTWRNDIVDAATSSDKTHDVKDLSGVRISIIARTAKPDPRYPEAQSFQLTDPIGNGKTYSGGGYRRMIMSSMVTLRNLAMRDAP